MKMATRKNCSCKDEAHHHQNHMKLKTAADAMQNSSNGLSGLRVPEKKLALMSKTLAARFEQSVNISNSKKKKKNNPPSEQELKLAAMAMDLNVRLRISDMPITMQEHALRFARSLVGTAAAPPPPPQRLSSTLIARSLKQEFDGRYGPAWHCVVGKSFGSFVTHSSGGFVYFSLDSLSFLLFKTEVQLVKDSPLERV